VRDANINMERVLYNFHSQLCGTVLRRSTQRSRRIMEFTVLLIAVFGFSILFICHVSFVVNARDEYPTIRPSIPRFCLSSIPNFQTDDSVVDVTHIILYEHSNRTTIHTTTNKNNNEYGYAVTSTNSGYYRYNDNNNTSICDSEE